MASSALRIDPLGAFNFYITLIDSSNLAGTILTAVLGYAVAGFSECSGLEATVEVQDYREGGVNGYVHKFATRATYSNLVLKHGVIYLYDDLWNWHYSWVQGAGTRKDGLIVLLDQFPPARQDMEVQAGDSDEMGGAIVERRPEHRRGREPGYRP